ncbi:hypothetical protein MMC12_006280 [Toensbergia leucococca]|nr:hypothetical protein [Toensbergia leucococca]
MRYYLALSTFAGLINLGIAGYTLQDNYDPAQDWFFGNFTFFTDTDPTNGTVTFVDQPTGNSSSLIGMIEDGKTAYIGVDHTNKITTGGRPSIRLTSDKTYDHGLFMIDLSHMPNGICGVWGAFWTVGGKWPTNGEIDIIEGVNDQVQNDVTLHTGPGCSMTPNPAVTGGNMTTTDCNINSSTQAKNVGCQYDAKDPRSFGEAFNANGGGLYAMEWTSQAINVWFWARGESGMADITSDTQDTTTWGTPNMAAFANTNCDIDAHFQAHNIIFDTTFCGDWAGDTWPDPNIGKCAASTGYPVCEDFVMQHPEAFVNAFWAVRGLKVYKSD